MLTRFRRLSRFLASSSQAPGRGPASWLALCLGALLVVPAAGDQPVAEQPLSLAAPAEVAGQLLEAQRLAPVDRERLMAEDAAAEPFTGPRRFAEALPVGWTASEQGVWQQLADGSRLWRLRMVSPGALSLNLRLDDFQLPAGARLWLHDGIGNVVQGPYTRDHRTREGQLWTALVPGQEAVLELHLPAGVAPASASFRVASVQRGYRPVGGQSPGAEIEGDFPTKQGSCNNDVVCPEGNGWRDQIRSVGWFTVNGIGLCTGTLMNNTAGDFRPYLLTAEHCDITAGNAGSMVVYWNYQSPSCGQLSGGSLADNQSGAIWRAGDASSDFTLVELMQQPDPAFDTYYAGWDATGVAPTVGVVGIHHPDLREKAISFDDDPLQEDDPGYWRVGQWEDGTTEPGSSGSCIFRRDTQLCVGTLTGGIASCRFPSGFDVYGRFDAHWDGPSPTRRLRDWLDPMGSGQRVLFGADPDSPTSPPPGSECVESSSTACLNGDRFRVSVTWRDRDDNTGVGSQVTGASDDSVLFWFFQESNWELLVKVLDGCPVNGRYWVLAAAATNVEYLITVTDTVSGQTETYENPLGNRAQALADTASFRVCP
ncbi:MAG: hypothetical protein SX243_05310 [Acidobacteriota bacterium]|nr:hypothetical protein [Acidobacteriota bacterium]